MPIAKTKASLHPDHPRHGWLIGWAQIARYMGKPSKQAAMQYCHDNGIPTTLIGRHRVTTTTLLDQWIATRFDLEQKGHLIPSWPRNRRTRSQAQEQAPKSHQTELEADADPVAAPGAAPDNGGIDGGSK